MFLTKAEKVKLLKVGASMIALVPLPQLESHALLDDVSAMNSISSFFEKEIQEQLEIDFLGAQASFSYTAAPCL